MSARIINRPFIFSFALLLLLSFSLADHKAEASLININTASQAELETLKGIGPAIAGRIINYRTNTPFQTIEDIKNVSGIGDKVFSDIRSFITVGSVTGQNSPSSNSVQPIPQNNTSFGGDTFSTHYSSAPLSPSGSAQSVALSAGRDRLGVTGSPLEFKAELSGKVERQNIFRWNFGDGYVKGGNIVTHAYEYPGEYAVVLSASLPEGEAVARVNVKIVEPNLFITLADHERIEITNNSIYETNLFGRALIVGDKVFVFPKDTIIKPNQKISFPSLITGLYPRESYEADLIIIGETASQNNIDSKVEEHRMLRIAEIQERISILENRIAQARNQTTSIVGEVENVDRVVQEDDSVPDDLIYTAQTGLVMRKNGWLSTLKEFFLKRK